MTLGAHGALNSTGQALRKAGHLQGWGREALLKGFDATESGPRAMGKTTEEIAHQANSGLRIASPEMEALGAKVGQPLGGLVVRLIPLIVEVPPIARSRSSRCPARRPP